MNAGLTEAQLDERKKFICGSDAEDAMNDPRRLWRIKTGREEEGDLYDRLSGKLDYYVLKHFTRDRLNLTRLLGHVTEDLNAFWYEKQTGRAVERRREWVVSTDPRTYWMAGNLDGVSTTSQGHPCYWDAKWTGRLDEAFMLRHTPQGVHNATILGFDWWGLSVFIGNGKWEWVEQEINPLYQANLITRERDLRGYIERDEEPPEIETRVLAPKPTPKLRTLVVPVPQSKDEIAAIHDAGHGTYLGECPECASLKSNEVFEALCRQNNWLPGVLPEIRRFVETDGAAKVNGIARSRIKDAVPEDVGELDYGLYRYKRTKAGAITMTVQKGSDDDAG